ncbi:helix-turn-helix transcriptional regulator [Paraliomyxa miuraensis]|uniref:helix-turn-helix transcriptional regulator n=2 Tax=Paraliomyxa miuraensis TaxID=376150 RepID=UPI002253E5F9|nr:hypothetical protein [Paraliomyxa miuraensis]MCX4240214.1 helix-turn-helix domain-containing protein [Paraliomyxa miuraensis]
MPRISKSTNRTRTNRGRESTTASQGDGHTSTSVAVPIAVDVRGASTITGFPVATLNGWRTKGGGPPFAKINKSVRYRVVDLEKWMADRVVSSTAEVAAKTSQRRRRLTVHADRTRLWVAGPGAPHPGQIAGRNRVRAHRE